MMKGIEMNIGFDAMVKLANYVTELETENKQLKQNLTKAIKIGNEVALWVRHKNYYIAEYASDQWIMFTVELEAKAGVE